MLRTGHSTSRRMTRIYPSILQFFLSRFLACFVPSPSRESEAECPRSCWTGRYFFITSKLPGSRGCTSRMKAMPTCSDGMDIFDRFSLDPSLTRSI